MGIYKTQFGREMSLKLYDNQLKKLEYSYKDVFVHTRFGRTHIIEIGNLSGEPLLVFHGGNSTTAYNLLMYRFLLKDFHIYAVDIIGHPGKSDEVNLSPRNDDYGKWANDVITALGFDKIACFGVSFGGGVLAKLMCTAPEKIKKSVLIVPSGINNAFPISTLKMMIPLLKYKLTKKEKYIKKTALFMAIREEVLDKDTLDMVRDSFDHVKTKVGMPSNVSEQLMQRCKAPTLIMAAEKDCLFPAKKVLSRAKRIIPNNTAHMLKGCGHMHMMPDLEKKMIVDFLSV
ncbi:alpha/beta hydrolase [Lysinibacillus sp. KCTC 33748]|uniref:alpha/beta fold hydrolase n=1 Tax=unclassified Lysinibacillus TaxID=2636778 RepID=UPI0009A6DDD6|nr:MULTISPECIES: alpha/beta hydrolase [unclassified Lysinibacillus]OXS73016.1 alpha/beta hydrolase [Lysinibacillus sp. KCTC 33748]SKB86006.1 Pimeloyl-ACP methyl ester carboxylesterase [Lysinibacillus sp. AC-3]